MHELHEEQPHVVVIGDMEVNTTRMVAAISQLKEAQRGLVIAVIGEVKDTAIPPEGKWKDIPFLLDIQQKAIPVFGEKQKYQKRFKKRKK